MRRPRVSKVCALLSSLTLLASVQGVWASTDTERDAAGLQKLGISETFGRWQGGIVQWKYNPTGAASYYSDDAAFVALLQQVMDEIEDAAGVDFQYLGVDPASVVLNYGDNVVTVGWDDLGGAAGIAGPASGCPVQQIVNDGYCRYSDGAVRFNNDIVDLNWDKGDSEASERLLRQVAMHELLHLLGLGHSDQPVSIMYANPYTSLHQLRADDIDGLQSLYGQSAAPAPPAQYTVPPDNVGAVIFDSYLAVQGAIQTPITTVGDSETASFVGVTWFEQPGGHSPIHIVVTGPGGYYFSKRVEVESCGGGTCGWWYSVVNMDTLRTYPGLWKVHLIVDGDLDITHTLDNQFTPPVINQAPDASISFDVVAGESPLTVTGTLTISGDNENDNVSATWHIPTDGETDVSFGMNPGQDVQQVTFTGDGDYEIYVEVTDDGSRYGTPGSGSEAGPGFRKLFRQVINVGPLPQPPAFEAIAALPNIGGGAAPEIAVAVPGSVRVHIRDASTGALVTNLNFGDDPAVDMEVVPDLDGNGFPEIAVLGERPSGQMRAFIKDSVSGAVNGQPLFGSRYKGVDMAVLADFSGNLLPEIAVMGQDGTDRVRVQTREPVGNTELGSMWYGDKAVAQALVALPDVTGNGIEELFTLGTVKASGFPRGQVRDPSTLQFHETIFFNLIYDPVTVVALPDINGSGSAEVAELGQDPVSGTVLVQVRDASDGAPPIRSMFLGAGNDAVDMVLIDDTDGNGKPDLAVLTRDAGGTGFVKIRDSLTGTNIRNIFFGAVTDPVGIVVLDDFSGNGEQELAVLGKNGAMQRVQVRDAKDGTQVNNVEFP